MPATITLSGNVVRDPEIKFGANGQAWTRLTVAVNNRKQVDGEWQDVGETSWYDVTVFRTGAEGAITAITKGTKVVVSGRLTHHTYEGRDGQKRTSNDVAADFVGVDTRMWGSGPDKDQTPHPNPGAFRKEGTSSDPWAPDQRSAATTDDPPF